MAIIHRKIDFKDISKLFGYESKIFGDIMKFLEKKVNSNKELYEIKFKKWASVFKKIYGELDVNLFLKHTYFSLILKILLIIKATIVQNLDFEVIYQANNFTLIESVQITEFEYFNWVLPPKSLLTEIYNFIESSSFTQQDLFHDFYQQIFISKTRHKIGEFYTPALLVEKMVDDVYKFGAKVLDPSCGSGSFLIDIIIRILNSKFSDDIKISAINNVYGFDINPLAILTVKVNIFLLFLEYFNLGIDIIPTLNIYQVDSLFPEEYDELIDFNIKELYNSFDLIIGNPPWLTYKDITNKDYQIKIRDLSEKLEIKPSSQYITHIELSAIFFYSIPSKFLKKQGTIFFVITKSVLNGDHCYNFRLFSIFDKKLEIWDFPNNYFFNVNHICLKAQYIGKPNNIRVEERYPIRTKIFNDKLELLKKTYYSSLKIEKKGTKIILPKKKLRILNNMEKSLYKSKFFQGATLVPKSLTFFQINEDKEDTVIISSDIDVISRAKNNWKFQFTNREVEKQFCYKTFLNMDLIPFYIKQFKNVFIPINEKFLFDESFINKFPKAMEFYKELNKIYQTYKKNTSEIHTLFDNLNYWNKLSKQFRNNSYIVIYNASGSNLKAAVINNINKNIIIGSENYYYSTDSRSEVYYLSSVLNAPNISKYIKLIKSSRHIHKRPFSFHIPIYDKTNAIHKELAKKGIKCESIVQDLFLKNPKINSRKVRIIINHKLIKIQKLVEEIIFNSM